MPERGELHRSEDCAAIAELLPAYLNRSLDQESRRRIESHVAACPACRQEEYDARTAWALYEGHLPVEQLLDYAFEPAMPSQRRAVIESHLAACERCATELSMVSQEHTTEVPAAPETPLASHAHHGRIRTLALAASLASLIAGGGWIWTWQRLSYERNLASLRGARANISVSELLPATQPILLRSGDDPQPQANRVILTDDGDELVLVLLSAGRSCGSDCTLEIYGAEKEEPQQRVEGLVATPDGHITLALPGAWLKTARGTILVVRDEASGQVAAEYLVEAPDQATSAHE